MWKRNCIVLILVFPLFSDFKNTSYVLKRVLSEVRAGEKDLSIKTSWEMPFTNVFVEWMLKNPIQAVEEITKLATKYRGSYFDSKFLYESMRNLEIIKDDFKQDFEEELDISIEKIINILKISQTLLKESLGSLPENHRNDIKRMLLALSAAREYTIDIKQFEMSYSQWKSNLFQMLKMFDFGKMLKASYLLMKMCEKITDNIKEFKVEKRHYFDTDIGKILLSGEKDDEYSTEDIKDVVLLIDTGGRNRYFCPIAAAEDGEIRILIDFGDEVIIKSTEASVGSGIFGIGLAYLPNLTGRKEVVSGDFSQGCGVLGVGGLFVSGIGEFSSGRFCQGAGNFGVGIFRHYDADGSSYSVKLFGQGAGLTNGIGLFLSKGNGMVLRAGLSIPDYREAKAAISLSQGVGYGPRFFAGGGIGICILEGECLDVLSNYISQGCGYWHGFGLFAVYGDNCTIRARRYNKGCGLHAGIGAMLLKGNSNRIINWGVGPAYGWDCAIGIFLSEGDDNFFQTEWGCGRGDINGHGLSVISGNKNILFLPGYGSGNFIRDAPSYGVTVLKGKGTRLYSTIDTEGGKLMLMRDPWGVLCGDDVYFDSSIEKRSIEWPIVARSIEGREFFLKKLKESEKESGFARLSILLRLISSFDPKISQESIKKILSIGGNEIPVLLKLFSPLDIHEIVILRLAMISFGKSAVFPILEDIAKPSTSVNKKRILINTLGYLSGVESISALLRYLDDPDWRIRSSSVYSLGNLFNSERGKNPGVVILLKELLHMLLSTKKGEFDKVEKEKLLKLFKEKNLTDLFSILSLSSNFGTDERLKIYNLTPNLFGPVNPKAVESFWDILVKKREEYIKTIEKELKLRKKLRKKVISKLSKMLNDPSEGVKLSVITALGKIGKYVPALGKFLQHDSAILREASLSSLSKMGRKAYRYLRKQFLSGDEDIRALISTSPFHGWDDSLLKILREALKDGSNKVRVTALSTLSKLEMAKRKEFLDEIRNLERELPPEVLPNAILIEKLILKR